MRYFIYLSYDGTHYSGWQNQPNAVTVQQTIEDALSMMMRQPIYIVGAGRTDAGVHARTMVAHVDLPLMPEEVVQLKQRLNGYLPPDIGIAFIKHVDDRAHARFDALWRTYHYYITAEKDPFCHLYALRTHAALDFDKMNEAASMLMEYDDFTCFSKAHTDVKTNLCRITKAEWHWDEAQKRGYFEITANRFLRGMVRAIVGTLLPIGRGKMPVESFRKVILSANRSLAGSAAPPEGLFMERIDYPQDIFL